jgi:hypothetical protein
MNETEVETLINKLEELFHKVQAQREFLSIKQMELRPAHEIAFFGLLQAREQLTTDTGLLAGHLQMIQEMVASQQITLSASSDRTLMTVGTYLHQHVF